MNLADSEHPSIPVIKAFVEASMPAVLSFGPIFTIIGLQGTWETRIGLYLVDNLCALVGALALSPGLLFL